MRETEMETEEEEEGSKRSLGTLTVKEPRESWTVLSSVYNLLLSYKLLKKNLHTYNEVQ